MAGLQGLLGVEEAEEPLGGPLGVGATEEFQVDGLVAVAAQRRLVQHHGVDPAQPPQTAAVHGEDAAQGEKLADAGREPLPAGPRRLGHGRERDRESAARTGERGREDAGRGPGGHGALREALHGVLGGLSGPLDHDGLGHHVLGAVHQLWLHRRPGPALRLRLPPQGHPLDEVEREPSAPGGHALGQRGQHRQCRLGGLPAGDGQGQPPQAGVVLDDGQGRGHLGRQFEPRSETQGGGDAQPHDVRRHDGQRLGLLRPAGRVARLRGPLVELLGGRDGLLDLRALDPCDQVLLGRGRFAHGHHDPLGGRVDPCPLHPRMLLEGPFHPAGHLLTPDAVHPADLDVVPPRVGPDPPLGGPDQPPDGSGGIPHTRGHTGLDGREELQGWQGQQLQGRQGQTQR
ncbi:hypothetical protein GCM10017744_015430 [Streptomyces antimycoticus]